MKAFFRSIPKVCVYAVLALALVLGSFVLGLRYWLLPGIDNYRNDIAESISKAISTQVTIGSIRAEWDGVRPHLELNRVQVFDRQNSPALELVKVEATLSWRSVLVGSLRLRSLELIQPSLEIKRDRAGKLFVAGIPVSERGEGGSFGDVVLEAQNVFIRDAVVSWEDEFRGAPRLVLDGVSLHLENRRRRHRFGLTAKPPVHLAGSVTLRGDLVGANLEDLRGWSGKLYAELPYADGGSWRSYIPLPKIFRGGRGAIRFWLDFEGKTVQSLVTDAKLSDTVVRLNENLPEMDLASLQGRIRYRTIGTGFEVASENLSLAIRGEPRTESTNFLYRTEQQTDRKEALGEFRANHLELAAWASLMTYLPLNAALKKELAEIAPSGRVTDLVFKWTGEPDKPSQYSLVGRIERGAATAVGDFPGVTGLTADVDADEAGGSISVESVSQLNLPRFFKAPLPADRFTAQAKWKRGNAYTDIALKSFSFANIHLAGSASGTYRIVKNGPGVADVTARFDRLEGRYTALYLPSTIHPVARAWLEKAIVDAKGRDATLRIAGDMHYFPFGDDKNGQFLFRTKVSEGVLNFADSWPRIQNINGEVTLRGHGLEVKASDGTILGAKLNNVTATVANLLAPDPILEVTGQASGPFAEKIRFINQSPVKAMLGGITEDITVDGNGKLALKLDIPLHNVQSTRVNGDYEFQRASLDFGAGSPPITEINGHLQFSETGARAQKIATRILGGQALLNVATHPDNSVAVEGRGVVTMEGMGAFIHHPVMTRLSGAAEWQGHMDARKNSSVLTVTSPLAGVASELPAPLRKPAAQEMPLMFERRAGAGKAELIRVSLGDIASGEFERVDPPGPAGPFLKRGMVSFGKSATLPDQDGVWLSGNLRTLNFDRWREILKEQGTGSGSGIAGIDLALNSIRAFDRRFANLAVIARVEAGEWRGSITGQELSGDFAWRPAGKGLLQARLKRLIIPDERPTQTPQTADASVGEVDFPALDIIADELQIRGKKLGRLELKAEQQEKDWRIERLRLHEAGSTFEADGLWSRATTSETSLKLKLEAPDAGKLLNELGFSGSMRNGVAQLSGDLAWPGAPYEMTPSKLSGNLKLEAKAGQFLKVEPGAGRLLGLMSLQSLPRRITLDFRDIFSEGFAFDDITGDVTIHRGLLQTKDFKISGPSANVEMSGDVNLGQETQDLIVKVIPTIGEGFSIATGLLGGPAIGVTAFILQKMLSDPISRAVAYEYNITGTWDNPNVVKLERKPSYNDTKQQ